LSRFAVVVSPEPGEELPEEHELWNLFQLGEMAVPPLAEYLAKPSKENQMGECFLFPHE